MTLKHIQSVKILGAGSIGNHLAHAARTLGCRVHVCDVNPASLERMRMEIYPSRYGAWDTEIQLSLVDECPVGGFDLICVGTPPESHVALALAAFKEAPRALHIEKPLCPPDLALVAQLAELSGGSATKVFVGYDHVVGRAAGRLMDVIQSGVIGELQTFDVEFREHWGGIFKAHPWLSGPSDSYLGFWKRGGGASGEHSHALNFWQFLSHSVGSGRVESVDAMIRYAADGGAEYDDCCFLHLRTESGMVGRVVQDVVTQPVRKEALVQGTHGAVRWVNGYSARADAVVLSLAGQAVRVEEIPKTRPDDFIEELTHIDASLDAGAGPSPISLERGLETMMVLAAAHRSEKLRCRVQIDYARGFSVEALH